MIINVTDQANITPALPIRRLATFVNSSLPVAVVGVPTARADGTVAGVTVALVNADAATVSAPCVKGDDGIWRTAFNASCFPTFGFVSRGCRIVLTLDDNGVARSSTLAVGDFEILPDSASSTPGDPSASYQRKGADIYHKTTIDSDGIQHYKKESLVYNEDMADWGLVWTGDYILVNGEFQPVE